MHRQLLTKELLIAWAQEFGFAYLVAPFFALLLFLAAHSASTPRTGER
jgi:hypothetical protein